jgi:hypothetical protein
VRASAAWGAPTLHCSGHLLCCVCSFFWHGLRRYTLAFILNVTQRNAAARVGFFSARAGAVVASRRIAKILAQKKSAGIRTPGPLPDLEHVRRRSA